MHASSNINKNIKNIILKNPCNLISIEEKRHVLSLIIYFSKFFYVQESPGVSFPVLEMFFTKNETNRSLLSRDAERGTS